MRGILISFFLCLSVGYSFYIYNYQRDAYMYNQNMIRQGKVLALARMAQKEKQILLKQAEADFKEENYQEAVQFAEDLFAESFKLEHAQLMGVETPNQLSTLTIKEAEQLRVNFIEQAEEVTASVSIDIETGHK